MERTKLVRLLSYFSESELRAFRDFVHSPYFNKNKKVIALLEFILKITPPFKNDNLTYENAFRHIFPEAQFKATKITKLLSILNGLAEQFISCSITIEDSFLQNLNLLHFYNIKNQPEAFEQQLKTVQKAEKKFKDLGTEHFNRQFQVSKMVNFYYSVLQDKGTGDVFFKEVVEDLDNYYLLSKLVYSCQMINRQKSIGGLEYSFPLVEELLELIPKYEFDNNALINLWYKILIFLTDPTELKYIEVKELIYKYFSEMSFREARLIFSYLENRSIEVFPNKKEYFHQLFDLYKFQIENKINYIENKLRPQLFKNIVTVGLKQKELDWVEQFIVEHKRKLFDTGEDIHGFCKALLYFEKGEYQSVLLLLSAAKLNNIYFNLNKRRLEVKSYYELELYDEFELKITSFRTFLSRNKKQIAPYAYQANSNFLNFIFNYYKNAEFDKKEKENLLSQINLMKDKGDPLYELDWLLEKCS